MTQKAKERQVRDFEKIPEMAYGFQAQVDFGTHWMRQKIGGRQKYIIGDGIVQVMLQV